MRLAFLHRAAGRQQKGVPANLEIGDAVAQDLVRQLPVGVGLDIFSGDVGQAGTHQAGHAAAARKVGALVLEQALADGPALAFLSDEIFLGHLHIVEKGFAERAHPADHLDRANFHAGRIHVDQQEADALVLVALVGAHDGKALVRPLSAAGPGLLSVDEVMVALVLGHGLQIGEVGAGIGFRISLAPAHFAPADRGDMLLLLRFVAVFQQGGAEHHNAHPADRVVGTGAGHLVVQYGRLLARQPAAAIFGRPGRRSPTAFAHRFAPFSLRVGFLCRPFYRCQRIVLTLQLFGKMLCEELLHFLAEGVLLGMGIDFRLRGHGRSPRRFVMQVQPLARCGAAVGRNSIFGYGDIGRHLIWRVRRSARRAAPDRGPLPHVRAGFRRCVHGVAGKSDRTTASMRRPSTG